MKRKLFLLFVGVAILAIAGFARMSDNEVLQYIKTQSALGKSEQVIGRELVARGVSPEQVERIKARQEREMTQQPATVTATDKISQSRGSRTSRTGEINDGNLNLNRNNTSIENIDAEYQTDYALAEEPVRKEVFGHNVFNERNLSFAPSDNLATPQNYILGPGDEVVIDLWGENEEHLRQTISPEGSIMVAQLGPIYLSGNTVQQANNIVRDRFARKYGGIADSRSDINVTLGQVRSIQVDVMGEVARPGTFRLSPFSTVFHALYNAGGINDIGTLRNIEVLRNGKRISNVDIYDYLFRGKQTGNVRLQEGDVIIVPPYVELVNVEGNVKRPMYYEIKPGETLETIIDYAGGFTGDAYSDMVRLSRSNGRENELVNVEKGDFKNYRLRNGDAVSVGTILDKFTNRVELRGAVSRPGMYALGNDIFTVNDLISKANGLLDDAYTGRVMLYREAPDLSLEIEAIDLAAIMTGMSPDIELRPNDMIVISSIHELKDRGELTIQGEVARPGTYPYANNTTVEDLIVQAGGLLSGASTARVDVARRIIDPTAEHASSMIAESFSLSIEKGLMAGNDSDFKLMPYDVVTVRRSPGYAAQEFVTIGGEVAFTGPYVLEEKNERIASLIARAGGVSENAYVRGASLVRKMSEAEILKRREAFELAQRTAGNDSINMQMLDFPTEYRVGIELDKALANPGCEYDVVLRDGDRIFIPEETTTVSINGEVLQPNTVTYVKGRKIKDYVNSAGGYTERANKKSVYIVYMNGNIKKAGRNTKVEPGCQILVPTKLPKQRTSVAEIMGYINSFASLGVMAASVASLLKK